MGLVDVKILYGYRDRSVCIVFVTPRDTEEHGLSQQGVWVPFWTPKPLKRTPQDTQFFLCRISKNVNL